MTVKVVFNEHFGGFSLSDEALRRLRELGVDVGTYGYRMDDDNPENDYEIERHDPRLVQVVEELGDRAHGRHFTVGDRLLVATLKGNRYIIREHDGQESVIEPSDIKWATV